jgi:hypothetical protein
MKEVLSLITSGIGALFFVVFFAAFTTPYWTSECNALTAASRLSMGTNSVTE